MSQTVEHWTICLTYEGKMMIKKILLSALMLPLVSCMSTKELVVETTKPWENHYYSVEQFQNGTKGMQLEKGESVWVISNRTLSRVLKNYMKNNEK